MTRRVGVCWFEKWLPLLRSLPCGCCWQIALARFQLRDQLECLELLIERKKSRKNEGDEHNAMETLLKDIKKSSERLRELGSVDAQAKHDIDKVLSQFENFSLRPRAIVGDVESRNGSPNEPLEDLKNDLDKLVRGNKLERFGHDDADDAKPRAVVKRVALATGESMFREKGFLAIIGHERQ